MKKFFSFFGLFFLVWFIVSCEGDSRPSEDGNPDVLSIEEIQAIQSIVEQNPLWEHYSNRLDVMQAQLNSLEDQISSLEEGREEYKEETKKEKKIPVQKKLSVKKKQVSAPQKKSKKKLIKKSIKRKKTFSVKKKSKKLYRVVIGAFRDHRNALYRRDHIRGLGIPVKIEDLPIFTRAPDESQLDTNPEYRPDYADYSFFFSESGEALQDGPVVVSPFYRVITEKSYFFESALEVSQFLISRGYSAHLIEKGTNQIRFQKP